MFKRGFDNERYLKLQSNKIKERISLFGERLYLEFGGKLFDDFHASRVLPGFAPDSKIKMLSELRDDAEIIINTTPVGMYPAIEGTPMELAPFSCLEGVVDAVYNPLCSTRVLDAKARGMMRKYALNDPEPEEEY